LKRADNNMSLTKQKLPENNEAALLAVTHAVASLQQTGYGSIEITVHEGRVTQIEKREKVRLQNTNQNQSK
jgi:hypothetical protein